MSSHTGDEPDEEQVSAPATQPRIDVAYSPFAYNIFDTIEKTPKLPRGRHAGKMYITVVYCDPWFCNRLLHCSESRLSAPMRRFRKWLIARCQAS